MTSPEGVRQAYGLLAERYTDLFGSLEQTHPDDLAFIDRHLRPLSGPVLDLGCGPGHLSGYLRTMHPDVTGIDLVPEFVAHARRAHPDVQFEVGSVLDLDRAPGAVAGALAWYSLIHLAPEQLDRALAAVRRVLAPGGSLVVGFFDGPAHEPFAHKVTTAYRWPAEEIARRLALAGFVERERVHRPREGGHRPHAAIAATAV
ncbi:class I SAM-dependent DNA methyltransferase [Cellulomonas phragmiteti]|uniref:Methyltransferase n=1 Tax=Cellulomonas phragmiteti TaxID=478780 RepID=A0ABQ4DIS3_9CELL|nr:class I SAM-dependent methyltransferase [Cellulomonas phragmiteti]GIG39256.1 methyltransferase [Cellulomonas phragmiteti]